jgi:hypothetical protein
MGGVHHPLGDGHEAKSFHGRADHPAGQETGAKKADVCRKHGVNGATFISEKFGGLDVLDAKRLRALHVRPLRQFRAGWVLELRAPALHISERPI